MRRAWWGLMARACRRAPRSTPLDSRVSRTVRSVRPDSRANLGSRTLGSVRLDSPDSRALRVRRDNNPVRPTTLCARRASRTAPRVPKVNRGSLTAPRVRKVNRLSTRQDSLPPNRPISRSRSRSVPSPRKRKASTRNSPASAIQQISGRVIGRFFLRGLSGRRRYYLEACGLEVDDTTGNSTKLAADPPSKILMVAFL